MLKEIVEERAQKQKLLDEIKRLVPEIPSLTLKTKVNNKVCFTFDVAGECLLINGGGGYLNVFVSDIPAIINFLQTAIGEEITTEMTELPVYPKHVRSGKSFNENDWLVCGHCGQKVWESTSQCAGCGALLKGIFSRRRGE